MIDTVALAGPPEPQPVDAAPILTTTRSFQPTSAAAKSDGRGGESQPTIVVRSAFPETWLWVNEASG